MFRNRKGSTTLGRPRVTALLSAIAAFGLMFSQMESIVRENTYEFLSGKRDFEAVTFKKSKWGYARVSFSRTNDFSKTFVVVEPYRIKTPDWIEGVDIKMTRIGESELLKGVFYNINRYGDTLVFVGK